MLLMSSKCLSVISRLVSLNQNTSFVHERHHELTIQQLLSLMFTLKSRRRCECCAVINMVLNPSAGGGGLTVCAGILMDINLISFYQWNSHRSVIPAGHHPAHRYPQVAPVLPKLHVHGWQHAPTSCLYGHHASPEEWCPWHVMAGSIGHVTFKK